MIGQASEHVRVRENFSEYFPTTEFGGYDAFVGVRGRLIKSEQRTRVVMLRREGRQNPSRPARWFVFKEYRYPWLPRIRTWLRISKAEHEFDSLGHVAELGLPSAEPVACGAKRTALGFVRSCFIITGFIEDTVTLEACAAKEEAPGSMDERITICRILGQSMRRLHEARFFLFTAKPKNLLLRRDGGRTEIYFIDLPYARFLRWAPVARWAQARDLGVVLGNYLPGLSEDDVAPFYQSYFPDPLGAQYTAVRKRVERAVRVKRHQTLVSGLVHRLRRGTKTVGARLMPKTAMANDPEA